MARTAAVYGLPALLIASRWLRLEETHAQGSTGSGSCCSPSRPRWRRQLWMRLALVPPAALVAAWVALDTPAIDERPGSSAPCSTGSTTASAATTTSRFRSAQSGTSGCTACSCSRSSASAPCSPRRSRPGGRCRRCSRVIAGAGWPAALYPSGSIALGAMILAAALWVLAGLRPTPSGARAPRRSGRSSPSPRSRRARPRSPRTACSRGSGGARAGIGGEPVSVRFVWNANYGGISFPKKKTTVLRITGPEARALLARDDPRQLRLRLRRLDREPDAALDRAGAGTAARGSSSCPTRAAEPKHLGAAGRRGARA